MHLLLDNGAHTSHQTDMGCDVLTLACENASLNTSAFQALLTDMNVNRQIAPKTQKWRAASRLFESMAKRNVSSNALTLDMAHQRGATALHKAAQFGHAELVTTLLSSGAEPSLETRNAMGCTPLEVATRFGPFPDVTLILVQAGLRQRFDSRFQIRNGRTVEKEAARAMGPGLRAL